MFGFLTKKMRLGVGKVGGFGKIAGMGDFVRTPSPSEEMVAFEGWLTRAMETAESRGGNAFKEAFVNGGAFGFLWAGAIDKKQRGLLGACGGSHTTDCGAEPAGAGRSATAGRYRARRPADPLRIHRRSRVPRRWRPRASAGTSALPSR